MKVKVGIKIMVKMRAKVMIKVRANVRVNVRVEIMVRVRVKVRIKVFVKVRLEVRIKVMMNRWTTIFKVKHTISVVNIIGDDVLIQEHFQWTKRNRYKLRYKKNG